MFWFSHYVNTLKWHHDFLFSKTISTKTTRRQLNGVKCPVAEFVCFFFFFCCMHDYTVKPLNSWHLRILKNVSVIKMCPLMGGSLTKISIFGTKNFVKYIQDMSAIWDVHYWEVLLSTVFFYCLDNSSGIKTYSGSEKILNL